jgi:hypothetical protein
MPYFLEREPLQNRQPWHAERKVYSARAVKGMRMAGLAWLRRLVVSIGIGGASYAIMLGIMVASIVYDRELQPIITFAFDTGRSIIGAFDSLVSGSHWGQVAVNHLRERVNMTHVVLSIPASSSPPSSSVFPSTGFLAGHGPRFSALR